MKTEVNEKPYMVICKNEKWNGLLTHTKKDITLTNTHSLLKANNYVSFYSNNKK